MKIETNVAKHAGQTVKYANNVRVTYNTKGVAEVTNETGEFLIAHYTDQIFAEGKKPLTFKRAAEPVAKPADTEVVTELKDAVARANRLTNDYKVQLDAARGAERAWRDKCDELQAEITRLNTELKTLTSGGPAEVIQPEAKPAADAAPLAGAVNTDTTNGQGDAQQDDANKAATATDALRKQLEVKTVKELIGYAEELKLPVEEYKKLNKTKLIEYLISKTLDVNA